MKALAALVGTKHRGADMVRLLATLPNGEPLTLKRENFPTDPNAVQVWARGHQIGYIPRTQNKSIAMAMDAAIKALRTTSDIYEKPARLAIDGGRYPLVEYDS